MEQGTGSKLGKEYVKAVYCHPAYLTYMQSTSWEMLGWMKHKLESRLPGETSITSDMQVTPPVWQKANRLFILMKVQEESEKAGLKVNIPKTKIMTSGPDASWQIDGETMETVTDFFSWAPKSLQMVAAAMKLKKTLAPWKKSYDQRRQCIKKQRHYFSDKGPSSQSYGFSSSHVWMWELDRKEGWALKNWCFLNCAVGEDSWDSLGLQGDPTSQS